MKKGISLVIAIVALMFLAANAFALDFISTDGSVILVNPTTPGAATIEFKPSPRCNIDGFSSSNGFAVRGAHIAAIGTGGGMEYGMASDTTKVYFRDISGIADASGLTAVSTSNSTAIRPPIMIEVQ